jgi:hypothetical protein
MKWVIRVLLVLVIAWTPKGTLAGNETPRQVAKEAAATRNDGRIATREADLFLSKVSTDLGFTRRLMEVAKGKDKAAVAGFIKKSLGARSQSEIVVDEIDSDWCFKATLTVRKFKISISFGTTCK